MLFSRLTSLLALGFFVVILCYYAFSSKSAVSSSSAVAVDAFSQKLTGFTSTKAPRTVLPLSPTVSWLYDQVWSENPSDLDFTELQAQCARGSFDKDIYLRCKAPYAGLTTIMSQLKTCIRLAVDTGNHLIIPTIAQREETDLTEFNMNDKARHKAFGEWFDEDALVQRLQRACPRMKVARIDKTSKTPLLDVTQDLYMNLAYAPFFNGVGNWAWPGRDWAGWYKAECERIITEDSQTTGIKRGTTMIEALAPLSFFNIMGDISGRSLRMWNEMNALLRFKATPRAIANAILTSPLMSDVSGVLKTYYGVHFRTEKDSPDVWIKADVQITRILDKAEEAWKLDGHGPEIGRLMYLACGDTDRIAQFEQAANARGWQVVDKYRLAASISTTLHESLLALPFDHQGMVDLGIMMLSEFFFGLTNSAFSFSIAHARDPRGRFGGSTLLQPYDELGRIARTHLFDDGEGAYQCCL